MTLPALLRVPTAADDGSVLQSLFLDLTIYLEEFGEDHLRKVIAWYEGVCPPGRIRQYIAEELVAFDDVARPRHLTRLGRDAAARGERMPFLATMRRRLREGRRFYLQLWDGERTEPWSLTLRAPHYADLGLRPFLRLVTPLDAASDLPRFASELAEMLSFHSGHGGLAFGYNPWFLDEAFDEIYSRARRFWGIDVEHLNSTILAVKPGIKGISWLTLLGQSLLDPELLATLERDAELSVQRASGGVVIRIGDEPDILDQNRPEPAFSTYTRLASVLAPLYVDEHDDFPGAFESAGNTRAWIRRFLEPDDWR